MPKKEPTKSTISCRMDNDVREKLEAYSTKLGVSINWLMLRAITEFLSELPPVDEIVLILEREGKG